MERPPDNPDVLGAPSRQAAPASASSISLAARRVNVNNKIRSDATPCEINHATREAHRHRLPRPRPRDHRQRTISRRTHRLPLTRIQINEQRIVIDTLGNIRSCSVWPVRWRRSLPSRLEPLLGDLPERHPRGCNGFFAALPRSPQVTLRARDYASQG